ncbi:MAG: 30S ribosomal protein S5 [Candidatus Pacebacteria bacterium]|nr:30S ribosomal protein S5 [Candidatus Paceibacterota bacterium]
MEDTNNAQLKTGIVKPSHVGAGSPRSGSRPPRAGGGARRGGRSGSFERVKPEFDQKILSIRRVTRVVAGGRRFSFSVALVAGDKKGTVGIGTGKAGDTSLAIAKALASAKKNMITIKMTKTNSIPGELKAKYASATLAMMPNNGRGIVSGSAVRDIIILAGLKDITSKIRTRSKNKLNIGRATIKALSAISEKKKHNEPAKPPIDTTTLAGVEEATK